MVLSNGYFAIEIYFQTILLMVNIFFVIGSKVIFIVENRYTNTSKMRDRVLAMTMTLPINLIIFPII